MRVLPTICVHMWSVSQVLSHSANGRAGHSGEIKCHLVYVTPAPVFTWFDRSHDGMLGRVKVFGRVLVFRRIATTHAATDHAQTQVNPGITHFQALFTSARVRFHISNLLGMRAFHGMTPRSSRC